MKELVVLVPTFNELSNVVPFLKGLFSALQNISFEVILVDDDSPDGTADLLVRGESRKTVFLGNV